jgi:hypothetical protein
VYAQPPADCILNHSYPLELFLTHGHRPSTATRSGCSYGVTLSWSIYSAKCGTVLSKLKCPLFEASEMSG